MVEAKGLIVVVVSVDEVLMMRMDGGGSSRPYLYLPVASLGGRDATLSKALGVSVPCGGEHGCAQHSVQNSGGRLLRRRLNTESAA